MSPRQVPWSAVSLSALIALLFVASALPVSTMAQGEAPELVWGIDLRLSDSTEISDDPTVALAPDGGLVVAWRERLLGQYTVFFAVLDGSGAIVKERQQLGEDLAASMDPAVAVDSSGDIIFVWTALEDQELWYAKASPSGNIEAGPTKLTDAEGDSAEVSVWLDNRDHLHLVWFDGRDGTTWLYYMQVDRSGNKVVEDTPLVQALTEQESAIAMDSRGDLHIAWNGIAPASQMQWNTELHYTKISTDGEVLVRDRLVATSRGSLGFPDMALDLSDDVHLVWPEGVGPRERVMYAQLDRSGRTMTDPMVVSGDMGQAARDVSIAADGNDRLHLVWSQGISGANDLHYATLEPGGERVGDPVRITESLADSREPAIGLSPRGEPRVVWSDLRSGNAEVYLKVATLPNEGIDMAVYARDISFEPPTVIAGEKAEIHVIVHNHGDQDAGRTDMTITFDFGLLGLVDLPPIAAGETYHYIGHVTMEEGEHWVRIEIDAYNDMVEHNNKASRSVRAYPPGTLEADAGPDIQSVVDRTTYLDATGTVYIGQGVLSYEWDLGDGSETGHGLYIEHVFLSAGTFTVTLRVSDGQLEDTDTCHVRVLERDDPPSAAIAPSTHIVADRLEPVGLSAEGSTDDNGIENYYWDLGDGSTAETMVVSHQYTTLGSFVVTLTVTDAMGQFDINKTTVEVVNLAPVIEEVTGPERVEVGEEVVLSCIASDTDGVVASYGWDFDAKDGMAFEETGFQAWHRYEKAGTYNITCIVRDDDGGQTVHNLEIEVVEPETGLVPGLHVPIVLITIVVVAALSLAVPRWFDDKDKYQTGNKQVPRLGRRQRK